MNMNRKLIWMLLFGVATLFTQCKDSGDEVKPDDENELITTVRLKFTEQGTTNVSTFSWKDLDGDGANATKDVIALKPNTTYGVTIELLDESKTPTTDITQEVNQESDEHLLIYTATPGTLLTYTYKDKDRNNFPVGITGTAKTAATAGTGSLKVQLRHQPGVKNGTTAPGSDDVNIDFDLKVQ
jgi:hypothetical protein